MTPQHPPEPRGYRRARGHVSEWIGEPVGEPLPEPPERPETDAVERSGMRGGADVVEATPLPLCDECGMLVPLYEGDICEACKRPLCRDAAAALDEWVEAMTTHEHTEPAP
jgi:hypothetical protein